MTERPILFSAPMVRAILEGRKTQTRRVVKLPHNNPLGRWEPTTVGGPNGGKTHKGETVPECAAIWHTRTGDCVCARYEVGDRLWVRETFYLIGETGECFYAATGDSNMPPATFGGWRGPWKPSIFMPRRHSRITLEVTGVRVERLQEISEADAAAEGVYTDPACPAYDAYRVLWDQINAKRAPWASNPWVWVIEFKRVTP